MKNVDNVSLVFIKTNKISFTCPKYFQFGYTYFLSADGIMIGLQLGCFIISSCCREKMESIHLKQNPSSLSFFSLDFASSCPALNGWYDDEPPIFPPERITYTQKMITPTTAHGIARNHSPSLNSLSRFTNNKSDTSSNKIAIVVQKDCFTENILCVKWIRIKFSY